MCHLSRDIRNIYIYVSVWWKKWRISTSIPHDLKWENITTKWNGLLWLCCYVSTEYCHKMECLTNTLQAVLLNTDRFCNFFNAHLIFYAQEERYIMIILWRTLLVKPLLYSETCNTICGLFNVHHDDSTKMLKEYVKQLKGFVQKGRISNFDRFSFFAGSS